MKRKLLRNVLRINEDGSFTETTTFYPEYINHI